jgi:hypothetical protein
MMEREHPWQAFFNKTISDVSQNIFPLTEPEKCGVVLEPLGLY